MNIQPDYQRLLKTLRHEEPDRVPLAELGVDTPIKDQFMGRPIRTVEDEVAFQAAAGFDYVYLRADYDYFGTPPAVSTGTPRAWAWSAAPETETISTAGAGPVQTLADLDTYPWPDPETRRRWTSPTWRRPPKCCRRGWGSSPASAAFSPVPG